MGFKDDRINASIIYPIETRIKNWVKNIMYRGLNAYGKKYEMTAEESFRLCTYGVDISDGIPEIIKDTIAWQSGERMLAISKVFYAMAEGFRNETENL